MIQRYFTEPYRFVPPYRSIFWCRIARPLVPVYLRRKLHVSCWHFEGLDGLRASLAGGAGILLAVNHSRWADPMVMAELGLQVNQFFYYLAAYHMFKQGRLMGWLINRLGGYSLWREGTDRESLRTSAQVLANDQRPLVIFPEGTWFRQNDRLGPIQEGLALIARQAARQCDRPIVVHPVAIKYWLLEDPRAILDRRLTALEGRLSWRPQQHLGLVDRIEKISAALLTIKEVEYQGCAQTGLLDERIVRLAAAHVAALEKTLLGKVYEDWILKRVRRLRQVLVRRLQESPDPTEIVQAQQRLEDLVFCENLSAHSHAYLLERPSLERLTEAVLRIEETVTDAMEAPVVAAGVTATVGRAIDARERCQSAKQDGDPLAHEVASRIQASLNAMLVAGPPPTWNCPARVE